jgi:glc operon protein GlcG
MRSAIACSLGLGAIVLLEQSAQAQLLEQKALSLEAARKMVVAAEGEAERNHWRGVIAVADEGGWLILLERMGLSPICVG